jgi:eukaryotic-like serine/threonine-protein kinase
MTTSTASKLGRYELLARIATGGMGEIFLARLGGAGGFEKLYVVKRILPHLANDARFRAMLIAEARVAANMSHTNICHVYELDESDQQLYIVMEYLEGVTLLALLRKYAKESRKLDYGFIAGVVNQVAEGLHYAHELRSRDGELLGIVHRDVTPSNLFLTESGVVKVHDFGVAKMKDAQVTESGVVKGKFAYMAPEQLQASEVDRRVDVFALGVVVAEMISNRRLFQRKTDYLTFRAVIEQPLPDFSLYRPDLPSGLDDVLVRALARDPNDRFQTARQLAQALVQTLPKAWDQVEISELVRSDFSEEIRRHHTEITGAINRSDRSTVRTMPIILESPSDPEAEEYATFETSVEPPNLSTPSRATSIRAASSRPSTAHPTIPPSSLPARTTRLPREPWLTLVAGVAVVAIGLFVIRIVHTTDVQAKPPAPLPMAIRPTASTASNPAYQTTLDAKTEELSACAERFDDRIDASTRIMLRVAVDGRISKLTFIPDTVERTALGHCLHDVLFASTFPKTTRETDVTLGVKR